MTKFTVHSRFYKHVIVTSDSAKASVGAAMRAKATEHETVIAVHRTDKLIQLYRVAPDGTVSRGNRIDAYA